MAFHLGFGLLSAQRPDDSTQTWTSIYDDLVQLVVAAETAGYDSAWVTEHHFTADGYLSACLPVLAACAARTSRIKLGTYVILAPLHHPLRLAEDAAAVDLLSHGRLILGLGIGYRDEEFDALGVAKADRVRRIEETVETCRQAWTGEPFEFRGRTIVCRPVPPGPPPLWLGAWVDSGIRRADRLADGYISPSGGPDQLAHQIGLAESVRGTPMPFVAPAAAWIDESGRLPDELRAGAEHTRRYYGEWYSSSSDEGGGRAVGERIRSRADATAGMLVGSPQQVIDGLAPLVERFARDRDFHLVVRQHWPGMPAALTEAQLHRFANEVAPALRALAPASPR